MINAVLEKLQLKIPPLLLAAVLAALIWFSTPLEPLVFNLASWQVWVAGILFDTAIIIALFGVIAFKKAQTTVNPISPEQASQLVNGGIYKYTRNPMYLGFLLALVAVSIYCQNPLGVLYCVLFVWLMNELQIKPEEKALQKLFGEEYRQYCLRVRRWI